MLVHASTKYLQTIHHSNPTTSVIGQEMKLKVKSYDHCNKTFPSQAQTIKHPLLPDSTTPEPN